MTKKEVAAMDALRKELRLAKAMRFTGPVEPDVEPPIDSGLSRGFTPLAGGSDYARIEPACSSSVSHGIGGTDNWWSVHRVEKP